MMALAWWRLSCSLRRGQAAGIVLVALLAGGVAATAWPSSSPAGAMGPLQLFRTFCAVQWLAAAAASLWASAAGGAPGEPGSGGDAAVEAELAWEDWFAYGKLRPHAIAFAMTAAGWLAGAGVVLLMLPIGVFAAAASGTGAGQLPATTFLAFLAAGAAATWGTAIQAGSPEGLRAVASVLVMGGLAAIGHLALRSTLPGAGPAMLSVAGGLRFGGAVSALGAVGAALAVAAVRRHLRRMFGKGGDGDESAGQAC